jgi:virginiamycin B lyase
VAGHDGAMWFVGASRIVSARNLIGRLAPSGRLRIFRVRGRHVGIDDVAPGPDGAMWFTDERGYIGRISARGRIAEFRVPRRLRPPNRITAGPDGAMWFTAGDIGRVGL